MPVWVLFDGINALTWQQKKGILVTGKE